MRSENLSDEVNDNIEQAETSGILITDLEKDDVVRVSTMEGDYKFTVVDPQKSIVFAEGKGFNKGGQEVHLAGSNWGGSMLKMYWIGPKTRIEAGRLLLPWTMGIMVNGKTLLSSTGVQ